MSIKKLYIPKNSMTRFKPGSHPTTERPNDAVEVGAFIKDTLGIKENGNNSLVLSQEGNWITPSAVIPDTVTSWKKISLSHSDIATSNTTNSLVIFQLAPKEIILNSVILITELFTGGSISNYQIKIGDDSYEGLLKSNINAHTGVDDLGLALAPSSIIFSLTDPHDIKLFATSTGGNLEDVTQGALSVYYLTAFLP